MQTTSGLALAAHPAIRIAISQQPWPQRLVSRLMEGQRKKRNRGLSPNFARTMDRKDGRRLRMDRGLGVRTDDLARYYPVDSIEMAAGALLDEFGSRKLLVYRDPVTATLAALRSTATNADWDGRVLHMDSGETLAQGQMWNGQGVEVPIDRPLHMFTRRDGFAFTFPSCEPPARGARSYDTYPSYLMTSVT